MIIEKYPSYFQKSIFFIYPLLNLNKSKPDIPKNTYLAIKDVLKIEDEKLICVYNITDDPTFIDFEENHLKKSKYYERSIAVSTERMMIHIFDISFLKEDLSLFKSGKYSQISMKNKQKILDFYKTGTLEKEYIYSFLFPEKYYSVYASVLDVSESILKEGVELAEPFDEAKECLILNNDLELS
jgi:hypothetical protein